MSGDTRISWTNKTWNPVAGCSKVSAGCDHCYAETLSLRRHWSPAPWTTENAPINVKMKPMRLLEPLRWKEPVRCFVNSMSDLFHDLVPDDFIADVFAVMAGTPQHTYQVLTKRPGRMASLTRSTQFERAVLGRVWALAQGQQRLTAPEGADAWPLANVWLGTSVEDQKWATVRIPQLARASATNHFLSCEPLLAPIDLRDAQRPAGRIPMARIDWVIVGGESGPHLQGKGPGDERWMDMQWARDIRDVCVDSGIAFFFKQDSGPVTEMRPWLVEPDGSRWEWHQYPGDLSPPVRIR